MLLFSYCLLMVDLLLTYSCVVLRCGAACLIKLKYLYYFVVMVIYLVQMHQHRKHGFEGFFTAMVHFIVSHPHTTVFEKWGPLLVVWTFFLKQFFVNIGI